MKYCEDCGYECSDDAKLCGLCGFAFGEMMEEADTKEYYKQQMLQNKQRIDDLMAQQRQMQLQMQTMQQQQWKQTQQQQRQQKMINHYNHQVSQQWIQAQAQNKGIPIRNMWSLIAAVVCLLPFFIGNFVKINNSYYSASYGLIEFCGEMVDMITYGSTDSFSGWVTSVLPLCVLVLVIVLIIGAYKAVHSARGWLVVTNIIAIIVTLYHVNCESLRGVSVGVAFWILVVGIGMATYSCWTDNPEIASQPITLSYDDIEGPAYNLSLLAADSSLELKQEWRCPKCDSKNLIDYKYCKVCSTSRG